MSAERSEEATRREVIFAVLAILSILIGISRIQNPLPPPLWMKVADVSIAAAFFFDWIVRIRASDHRWRYIATHSYELLFFIPFTLLPATTSGGNVVRGARLFRLLRFARFGRYTKLGLAMTRLPRRIRHIQVVAQNAQIVTILIAGAITVSLGGAALLIVEGTASGIRTYAEALWWSLSLFTTVAYDIPEPQTLAGRVVSGILMVAGVAYVGIFTASLASAILRTRPEDDEEGRAS